MSIEQIRAAAEADLGTFIRLVAPHRVLGAIHEELIDWWTRSEAKDHQLTLLPRDHQKSAMIAYRVAWTITKDPSSTFLYISSTSGLAEKQLYFIKNILDSKIYRRYWPEMTNSDEGKREKWTNDEIIVDHPKRKLEGVRDATIKTAGLTTGITGLHFTHAVLDDVVVKENAYTNEGRKKVEGQYSLLSSIESTGTGKDSAGAFEWAVGTRYHPKDLYNSLMTMEEDVYGSDGEVDDTKNVYEVFERQVEDRGDGSGEFIWPRQQNKNGRWYGFTKEILAKKRAKYVDKIQYYAQYYNNPNEGNEGKIDASNFQYYDRKNLKNENGDWIINRKKIRLFAAIDFAFSLRAKADYTAIVVIGIDVDHNIYVVDIARFKVDSVSGYYKELMILLEKWDFRKLRAEVSVGQKVIVQELKNSYLKPNGIPLSIDEFTPSRMDGSKEERMSAVLDHRYENQMVWHYKGGNCQSLEEELILVRPPHDDIKDALAAAISIAKAPARRLQREQQVVNIRSHNRFGGI